MRKWFSIIAGLFLFQHSAKAQDTANCHRNAYKLIIPVSATEKYEQDLPAGAYLLPDTSVQIYPGETINLEVTLRDGQLQNLKPVCKVIHPENTIVITLTQVLEKKKHKMMMLKIVNPFSKDLLYHAYFFPLNGNKWIATDVLPVYAKLSGYETWPTLIVSMALRNFAFKAE